MAKQVIVAVAASAQAVVSADNAQQLTATMTVVSGTTVDTFDTQVSAASSINQVSHQQSHMMGRLPSVGDHLAMHIPASSDHMLPSTVPSDEQLEMALDDLPMLDSDEDLPFDSLTEEQVPPVASIQQQQHSGKSVETHEPQQQATKAAALSAAQADDSVENTAESTAEGDDDDDDDDDASSVSSSSSDDDDDDDDDNGSANSGSPMPSPSPQSSPMMSHSPSP